MNMRVFTFAAPLFMPIQPAPKLPPVAPDGFVRMPLTQVNDYALIYVAGVAFGWPMTALRGEEGTYTVAIRPGYRPDDNSWSYLTCALNLPEVFYPIQRHFNVALVEVADPPSGTRQFLAWDAKNSACRAQSEADWSAVIKCAMLIHTRGQLHYDLPNLFFLADNDD